MNSIRQDLPAPELDVLPVFTVFAFQKPDLTHLVT